MPMPLVLDPSLTELNLFLDLLALLEGVELALMLWRDRIGLSERLASNSN